MYYLVNSQKIEADDNGYILDLSLWSLDLCYIIAQYEKIELNEKHFEIINFVREFYQKYQTSPAIRLLVKSLKEKYGEEIGNSRYLMKLFPDGPAKQACKLAGLPKPIKCL